ncbi:MAG: NUDIX hydrolase [Verrucomicrobia bacterium]|nr:NUDIX hydrolase [Verrucomicrobiota bacterium]MBI3867593.1 NUDIX hydrolase [Verrucomicrobiota bacterium]
MSLPHKISTLLYVFDPHDRILLLQRAQEPNRGLWSPCGGKLKTELGESPHACGCREAREEMGVHLEPTDLHLTGVVSETGYQGSAHWLMFLFEVKQRLDRIPPPHAEGLFAFFTRPELERLAVPSSDRAMLWPLFWEHRGGFFSAHCRCEEGKPDAWSVYESRQRPPQSRT